MNNNMVAQQEFFLTEYARQIFTQYEFNNITTRVGPFVYCLFMRGLSKDLFTGTYDQNDFPKMKENATSTGPAINRLFNIESVNPDLVGAQYPNGWLKGPLNEELREYEAPNVPANFGARLEREDGKYFTYGFTDHVDAVLMYFGDRELDTKGHTLLDYLIAFDEKGKRYDFHELNFGKYKETLNTFINGYFGGNAGTFTCKSASGHDEVFHEITIKQPLMYLIKNREPSVLFRDNAKYVDTTKFVSKKLGARPEFKDNKELSKYVVEVLIGLRFGVDYSNSLGHDLTIDYPENKPEDSLKNLIHNGVSRTLATLYGNVENPFMPNQRFINRESQILADADKLTLNELFCRAIGEATYLRYEKGMNKREIDYRILGEYGWTLLNPIIQWNLVMNQLTMQERFYKAGVISGSINKITLEPFLPDITTPPAVGRIKVIKDEVQDIEVPSIITFGPNRDFKLHRIWVYNDNPLFNKHQFYKHGNVYTTCFGSYCKKGYKPLLITEIVIPSGEVEWDLTPENINDWGLDGLINPGGKVKVKLEDPGFNATKNPDFYEHLDQYTDFFYPLSTLEKPKRNASKTDKRSFYQELINYLNFFKPQLPHSNQLIKLIKRSIMHPKKAENIKI